MTFASTLKQVCLQRGFLKIALKTLLLHGNPLGGQPPQPTPPSVQRLFDYQSISRIMEVLMVYSQSAGCLDHLYYSTFSGNDWHFFSITSPIWRALHILW
ncbi:hypothetical protein [Synechocystis sp. PCC 7509]|uniref:hypothetical protein n=1 Tax=Synechocystis sp. PCC 7509 TaxID=927677 RepID=UPI0011DCA966|nr:hypothetical protein [Synechocystis sp. PCC 7509]